ncbi:MAG: glycosyltransferase family 4 protein [Aureliella sp.]
MRIALVITELDPGGAERCLTELAIYLAQRGHHIRVLALGPLPSAPYDDLVRRLTGAGIEVRSGNARGASSFWRITSWLRSQLDAFQPDLVQAMLWHANVVSAVALRGRATILIGGMRVSEPRRWRWPIERWAARRMTRMVCVSEDVRRHALEKERLPTDKLVVIPNGVPLEQTAASEPRDWSQLGVNNAEHVLLFVGRLEPQKGVLPLAEHAAELLAGLDGWSLVFIGRGSLQGQIEAALKTQPTTAQSVKLVGWQNRASSWMASSDVVLLPAQYEGMPNVLLEAMAAGKPLVAFSVDGVKQLLEADYANELADAQLAPPGDWPAFIKRVRELAANSDLRATCSRANRAQVAKHFRLAEQRAKYATLYPPGFNRGAAETGLRG